MEPELIKAKRSSAWADIILGCSLLMFYATIVLMMFGICLVPPIEIGIEMASFVEEAAAPTIGDWLSVLLIVSLGAFWGVHLINHAMIVLRFCRIDEPESASTTSQSPAKV